MGDGVGDGLEARGGGDCKQKMVEAGLGGGCEGSEDWGVWLQLESGAIRRN